MADEPRASTPKDFAEWMQSLEDLAVKHGVFPTTYIVKDED